MCGICGYIGYETSFNYGYLGILKLLNRGYDSVGITTINKDNTFMTHKFASDDREMADSKIIRQQHLHDGTISILHSRWRTVGAKSDVNSHPHLDCRNKFSIVHNGIIENYAELRKMLTTFGYTFVSETDTEVIANMISFEYSNLDYQNANQKVGYHDNIVKAIREALSQIEGTYALAILCVDTPNMMYCVRHGSPLLIGQSECNEDSEDSSDSSFMMVASECHGFDHKIKKYVSLESNDIVSLHKIDGKVTMKSHGKIEYNLLTKCCANLTTDAVSPAPFPHWTIKEIHEQSVSCVNAIGNGGRITSNEEVKLGGLDTKRDAILKSENIILLGCGTSYHAGLLVTALYKSLGIFNTVQIFDGAEFTENDMPIKGQTCYIFISQSGETKDLHRCLEMIKSTDGQKINIGVINTVESLIAREVDCGVYLNCGREMAVASTKAFTSQVIALSLIAAWFSQNVQAFRDYHFVMNGHVIPKIRRMPNDILKTIETNTEMCKKIAVYLKNCPSIFLLGKDTYYSVAREGALKLKEIGYIHAEGYSSAALKHGPYALLTPGFPVILFAPNDATFTRNQAIHDELKSRDAIIIGVSDRELPETYDFSLIVPAGGYTEILMTILTQMISYYLSVEKGINPDYPRNIAKVLSTD
jgi:glucosamine--fructose-6-phosphate aminotransferase (isomerizing)